MIRKKPSNGVFFISGPFYKYEIKDFPNKFIDEFCKKHKIFHTGSLEEGGSQTLRFLRKRIRTDDPIRRYFLKSYEDYKRVNLILEEIPYEQEVSFEYVYE